MELSQNQKLCLALVVVLVVAAVIYFCSGNYKNKEGFTWANAVQEFPGTYDLSPNDYDMLDNGSLDPHKFADIVLPAEPPLGSHPSEGYARQDGTSIREGYCPPTYPKNKQSVKGMENAPDLPLPTRPFDNDYDPRMLLPDDTTSVTMFDRDLSDPTVYLFRSSNRAQIKNRQHATADMYRGDLAITPCRRGWFDSRYSEGDSKLDAYFSPYTNAKYAMLTGQNSYPQNISNEAIIMDYTGNGDDPVMGYY